MEHAKHLIVIDGSPATGKTKLANDLSQKLSLAFVSKDTIKELLFDHLGTGNLKWSKKLGAASFELLWWVTPQLLQHTDVIIETHFNGEFSPPRIKEIARQAGAKMLLIHLTAEVNTRIERCIKRVKSGERHKGHCDISDKVKLTVGKALPDGWTPDLSKRPPMDLGCDVIEIETSEFEAVDYVGLEQQVKSFLDS
jgi:predicted kinase